MFNGNEVKKEFYKNLTTAKFITASKDGLLYKSELESGAWVAFLIPFSDFGDAIFKDEMYAKHLIRWLIPKNQ